MKKFAFLVILLPALGCGRGDVAVVKGQVNLNQQPLAGARVQFQPLAGNRPSSAITDGEGKFALQYALDQAGAEIGRHRVEIRLERTVLTPEGQEYTLPDVVPVKYNARTTLESEVRPGSNELNFDLTSP